MLATCAQDAFVATLFSTGALFDRSLSPLQYLERCAKFVVDSELKDVNADHDRKLVLQLLHH